MTLDHIAMRAVLTEAARLLADERLDLAERVRQTTALLRAALDATEALPPAYQAALDADPGLQAALRRLAACDEAYSRTGPDGGPSDEPVEPGDDERPVGPDELARLGL